MPDKLAKVMIRSDIVNEKIVDCNEDADHPNNKKDIVLAFDKLD